MTEGGEPEPAASLRRRLGTRLLRRAHRGLDAVSARRSSAGAPTRGLALTGTVWTGGDSEPEAGVVVFDGAGIVRAIHLGERPSLPHELLVLGGVNHWVVPGIVDAHVHLGFDPGLDEGGSGTVSGLRTGLVGVRDLGAPLRLAGIWQTGRHKPPRDTPFVAAAGPVLTAPGGYPAQSWGASGYAEFLTGPAQARSLVQRLAADGVDLIKIALEPGSVGWPVPTPDVVAAVVQTAHNLGLSVVAHALTQDMVRRAVEAGVDELAHTPTERLSEALIERIAASGLSITSTLQTFFSGGAGREAAANATDLVAAGVRIHYGTDLGNTGTHPGVDPRELDRLADAGLGRLGALRAATEWSSAAAGIRSRSGLIRVGQPATAVLLPSSPLTEPGAWRTPSAICCDGRLTVVTAPLRSPAERPTT